MKKNNNISYKSSVMNQPMNFVYRSLKNFCLILAILVIVGSDLAATHIVGGNITYRKVGPNTFEVTLELRRDCFLGSQEAEFDDPASIGIFSSQGALQFNLGTNGQILMPYDESDTLNNVIISDCGFEGEQVCVEEFKYIREITLPPRSGGYVLGYQRCCRNGSLNNVNEPLETGATYFVSIPESAFDDDNDSPVFNQWPPVYICANEALNFDHSAFDTDGDSLVYKLCVPKNGATRNFPKPQPPKGPPYDDIEWKSPFDLDNLLGGIPLEIDSETGLITGTPNSVGQFLVGVCVEEYRDGVLIGSVNRDFQYNVRVCSEPPMAAFDAPTENCDGLTVDFTNNSVSATEYLWIFDYPNSNPANMSTEVNPSFTFPTSGSYDVFLQVVRGTDQCNDSIVQTINVFNAEFNADFSTSLTECLGTDMVSYTFTDQSVIDVMGVTVNEWNWTVVQNGVTETFSGNPLTIDLLPGDYEVSLQVRATNGCVGQVTKTIKYEDFELVADFDTSIGGCTADDSITIVLDDFTTENNPNYTISEINWVVTFTGANSPIMAQGDLAEVTLPRTNFNVKLTVLTDNNCSAEIEKDFSITSFIPTVDFDFALSGCDGDNNPLIQFIELSNDSVTYSNVKAYNWTFNTTTANGDTVVYESVNEDSILAQLQIEFADGCTAMTSKTLYLDSIRPQVNYIWVAEECPTDDSVTVALTFDSSRVFGLMYDELIWNAGIQSDLKDYTGSPVLITVPKDSTVFVTLSTNFENACTDEISNSFYPGDFATIELVGDTLVLCPNEEGPININGNPNLTYTWTPTTGLDLTDPSSPIVNVTEDTWYYVTVTDGVCSVNDSILVDVIEQIDLVITGNDFTCFGDVFLTASGAIGPGVYEWSYTSTFDVIIGTGPLLSDTFEGLSQTYFVRYVGETCNANTAGFTVTNQTPEIDFVDPFEMCPKDTITYPILNNNPAHDLTIVWEDDPHILEGGMTLNPTITIFESDSTSFDLYFTVTNQFGCDLMDTLTIDIGENPVVDFTFDVVDCGEYEVCFAIVGDYNGFPIWDLGDTTTTLDEFLIPEVCYTYPGPGMYEVTLSNASSVCPFETVIKKITLTDTISAFELDAIEVCINEEIDLIVPDSVLGLNYTWCTINGDSISNMDTLTVIVTEATSYVLKVVDDNGCPFSDTLDVNVFDFDYELIIPEVYCAGEEVETGIEVEGGLDYIYEWGPADCIVSGGNTANPIFTVTETKMITVMVTHPTLGCALKDSFSVTPIDLIIDVDAEPDTEIFLGDSVEIFVNNPMDGDKYEWSNGDTMVSQVVRPVETTTYTVTVTDEDGCTGVGSVTITVIQPDCEEDVFLPTAFSPNGDDVNSILYVRSNFLEEMELIIYSRWNEEVFRSTDQAVGWDGTFKGKKLAPDAYAYYLRAICADGFEIERSGSINLIR